ncbi:MAG: hypothetical protein ACRD04_13750 [Terriglobales bacterium]
MLSRAAIQSRREFFRLLGAGLLWAYACRPALATERTAALARFRTRQIGERWLLLTPAGHPYWMLGVFHVDLATTRFSGSLSQHSISLAKYGSETVWALQAARRLRAWGFNCLAEYASEYTLPVPLYGRDGNAERMPFMGMIRPAAFSLTNRWNYASGPVKDIVAATDARVYRGWRGSTVPDVFDSNFALYARNEAAALAAHLGHSPYLVGITCDDADDLYGFGPGPDLPVARLHPHLGWLVLISNFQQRANTALGVRYSDLRLHSKYELRAALRRQYGDIARLNQAWHSDYTSFGSDGGWPFGRGLLDESGRGVWLGQGDALEGAGKAVRADLDTFLGRFAQHYFQCVGAAVRASFPGFLVFGPATLNGWNGLTRAPILRAAGAAMDVVQASAVSSGLLRRTAAATGNVPLVTWTGMIANRDSDLFAYPQAGAGARRFASQEARGAAYAATILGEWEHATDAGIHPVVGTKFWAFADSWAEKMNWGLVSLRDNAYDGRQAVRARGHDQWGFATGGESRDFGDSLTAIRAGNHALYQRLWEAITAGRSGDWKLAG